MSSAVLASVQRTVDGFNQTAGGPVQGQQTLLATLVAPGQRNEQRACPLATTTIVLDPVYSRLALAPRWHPANGAMTGRVYALPTLIRIYTGGRITGTDLTDLHVAVDTGQVAFPAICVR